MELQIDQVHLQGAVQMVQAVSNRLLKAYS